MKNAHSRSIRRVLAACATATLLAPACESPFSPGAFDQLAFIAGFNVDDPHIDVPATVAAGSPFAVEVTTYGGGCVSEGYTQVSLTGRSAIVTPWDRNSGGEICTLELRSFRHSATLRFDERGIATVTIRGMRVPGDEPVQFDRHIVVE